MNELASRFRHAFLRIQDPAERLPALKAVLREEQDRIRAEFETGAGATATTGALTDLVDALLRAHLEARINAGGPASELALVAVGGYGRREMCPMSDIDLLILTPRKASAAVLAEAEQILYPLWDLGFVVGQSVRSIADCRKAADADVETYTAFLQERFLCGNHPLYREFADFTGEHPTGRRQKRLVQMKLVERAKRLSAQGQLAQMLEPNLKEGRGCLRDLHTLVWLAGIQHGARGLDDLVRSGIIGPEELPEIREANQFLLRARIALHYVTGQKNDRLGFDEQVSVARFLGYRDHDGHLGVERFQKDFYRHVRTLDSSTSVYCDGIAAEARRRGRRVVVGDPRFQEVDGALEMPFNGPNPFLGDLSLVLELYRAAQKAELGVGPRTRWFVRQAISLLPHEEIDLETGLAGLLEIARHSGPGAFTLRELHRLGVVKLVVPDFALIDCHSQHDIYHLYTTDEHTLTVLARLAGLPRSEDPVLAHLKSEHALIADLDVLFVAALFHDVGKGLGADHSESGAKLVREYCLHAGFSDARAAQASDLVLQHLLLNHVAQRRDIEDPKTVRDVLGKVADEHLLRKLYVLTWADTSSVHPDAWSAWKAQLLRRLYISAQQELSEEHATTPLDSASRRELLAQDTFGHSREEVLEHLKRLPRRYASSISNRQLADHMDLVSSLSTRRRVAARARALGTHFDLAVVSPDRPGLLARICAGLSTLRLSIVTSQVYTRVDGVVIDLFSVIPRDPSSFSGPEDLAAQAESAILAVRDLPGPELDELVATHVQRWAATRSRIMTPETRIEFHDHASDDYTVLDVTAPDRLGLLYRLTSFLSRRQWVIHSARVCTEADRAIDSFSLTTAEGARISDPGQREAAAEELRRYLA